MEPADFTAELKDRNEHADRRRTGWKGKGWWSRVTKSEQYRRNWDRIFGKKGKKER
jgi:hypothetical protein